MLAVLIESRARQPRRAGGAALSVAAHLAIVGAAAAVTAPGSAVRHPPDRPVWVNVVAPHEPAVVRQVVRGLPRSPRPGSIPIPRVRIDNIPGPVLAINLKPNLSDQPWPSTPTCIDCRGSMRDLVGDPVGEGNGDAASPEWRGSELLMRTETSAVPRYPPQLRDAGIEGTVIAQFTVDTTGRVDMTALKILSSTHALFTDAVQDALARFRFRPAEVGGRRVPALAQMPFEFRLRK